MSDFDAQSERSSRRTFLKQAGQALVFGPFVGIAVLGSGCKFPEAKTALEAKKLREVSHNLQMIASAASGAGAALLIVPEWHVDSVSALLGFVSSGINMAATVADRGAEKFEAAYEAHPKLFGAGAVTQHKHLTKPVKAADLSPHEIRLLQQTFKRAGKNNKYRSPIVRANGRNSLTLQCSKSSRAYCLVHGHDNRAFLVHNDWVEWLLLHDSCNFVVSSKTKPVKCPICQAHGYDLRLMSQTFAHPDEAGEETLHRIDEIAPDKEALDFHWNDHSKPFSPCSGDGKVIENVRVLTASKADKKQKAPVEQIEPCKNTDPRFDEASNPDQHF